MKCIFYVLCVILNVWAFYPEEIDTGFSVVYGIEQYEVIHIPNRIKGIRSIEYLNSDSLSVLDSFVVDSFLNMNEDTVSDTIVERFNIAIETDTISALLDKRLHINFYTDWTNSLFMEPQNKTINDITYHWGRYDWGGGAMADEVHQSFFLSSNMGLISASDRLWAGDYTDSWEARIYLKTFNGEDVEIVDLYWDVTSLVDSYQLKHDIYNNVLSYKRGKLVLSTTLDPMLVSSIKLFNSKGQFLMEATDRACMLSPNFYFALIKMKNGKIIKQKLHVK